MRPTILATALLLASPFAVGRLGADTAQAGMQVSVEVVRSCQVQAGGQTASLECGRGAEAAVQVSVDGDAPALKTLDGAAPGQASTIASTPDGTRTLSVDF